MVKQIWNEAMHVLHQNFWYILNTRHLRKYRCAVSSTKERPAFEQMFKSFGQILCGKMQCNGT